MPRPRRSSAAGEQSSFKPQTRSAPPPCGWGAMRLARLMPQSQDPHPQPLPTRGRGAHQSRGTALRLLHRDALQRRAPASKVAASMVERSTRLLTKEAIVSVQDTNEFASHRRLSLSLWPAAGPTAAASMGLLGGALPFAPCAAIADVGILKPLQGCPPRYGVHGPDRGVANAPRSRGLLRHVCWN
jgi:hypothetical protein